MIARNTIRNAGNNGIQVWRSQAGDDGTQVIDNRIEDTLAQAGGSGQNGNAINVFRAHNVIVRGNRIRNAAFSAVRGNAASNIQITNNTCTGLGEVAIYAEFGFEGAVIANNTIDGAAIGVAVTNFNQGGRLAVVQGNLIRNLVPKRPAGTDPNDGAGIGIGVEADTAVTGNIIENAPTAGISVGWGQYLRDVSVTGNVVRGAGVGIAVSVVAGRGLGGDRRQPDRGRQERRDRRHGPAQADDRRSRARRRRRATRSLRSTATGCATAVPPQGGDARVGGECIARILQPRVGKLAHRLYAVRTELNPPSLTIDRRVAREGLAGQNRKVRALAGIAHELVFQHFDAGTARRVGEGLTRLVVRQVRPDRPVGHKRARREIEAERRRMANRESRELAGIRGPRRLRRLGKEQQPIERRFGDRRRG